MNLDPNYVIFNFVDSMLSSLSKYIKIPNFLAHFIEILNFNLIKFQRIHRKYHNSPWIRPIFISILSNSRLIFKIGEFGNCFDACSRVFNDLVDL